MNFSTQPALSFLSSTKDFNQYVCYKDTNQTGLIASKSYDSSILIISTKMYFHVHTLGVHGSTLHYSNGSLSKEEPFPIPSSVVWRLPAPVVGRHCMEVERKASHGAS